MLGLGTDALGLNQGSAVVVVLVGAAAAVHDDDNGDDNHDDGDGDDEALGWDNDNKLQLFGSKGRFTVQMLFMQPFKTAFKTSSGKQARRVKS